MTQKIEKVQPSIDPTKAIDLLKKQADKIDEIISLDHKDPKVHAWENFTEQLIVSAFGKPHDNLSTFRSTLHSGGPIRIGMSDQEWQDNYVKSMQNMKELLISFTEQLKLFAPSIISNAENNEPKRQYIQNFYITQSQAQQIENTINIEE